MSDVKFCEDCKWFDENGIKARCRNPKIMHKASVVTRDNWVSCEMARSNGYECGYAAKLFEPRMVKSSEKPYTEDLFASALKTKEEAISEIKKIFDFINEKISKL